MADPKNIGFVEEVGFAKSLGQWSLSQSETSGIRLN